MYSYHDTCTLIGEKLKLPYLTITSASIEIYSPSFEQTSLLDIVQHLVETDQIHFEIKR